MKYIRAKHHRRSIRLRQRNYYEHIIRNEESLNRIQEYIINNPLSWKSDRLYPDFTSQ